MLLIAVLVAVGLGLTALPSVERQFQIRSGEQGRVTLQLTLEGLTGALRRFEPLPALIGERPILAALLQEPHDGKLADKVSEELRLTANKISASDVYLMDMTGLTIAASSYRKDRSFVGRSFHFRPYFQQAVDGGIGRYFALGTTSLERGYFFAAPVIWHGEIRGVLAVKFTVDRFEQAWRGGNHEVIVSDLNNVIFMSSRTDWHLRTLRPLSRDALAELSDTRQYPADRLIPLPNSSEAIDDKLSLMTVSNAGTSETFVANSTSLPDVGWTVSSLVPASEAKAQAWLVFLVYVLIVLFVGMVLAVALLRRSRMREVLEAKSATQVLLEQRVSERTAELDFANRQLRLEIEERKAAEQRLRTTQNELIQAGKLAALGQMSAAISHEINQPLTAVKSYADNAVTFLDRNRPAEARDNLTRISAMVDRIAAIGQHLRNFARRPKQGVGPVDLVVIVEEALQLMHGSLRSKNVTIDYQRPRLPQWVLGGSLRLQQVVVNLLSNALDAMSACGEPIIEIDISELDPGRLQLAVRDRGPGLGDAALAQIFDPFFTTKSPGSGLGLGLSISYNIVEDFGGRLRAQNHPQGGAVFIVELKRSQAPAQVASAAPEAAE